MAETKPFTVLEYLRPDRSNPYRDWLASLDAAARARVQARVLRFEAGNLGDHKSLRGGVFEARLDFGPGYRVYFGLDAGRLVILLIGGDKSTQARDILVARTYWQDYTERTHGPQNR